MTVATQSTQESEPVCTEKEAQESAIKVFRVVEWDAIKGTEDVKKYAIDVLRRAGF